MGTRTVLISGAGIAGSTLAYWLARYGFEVTVVERSAGLRSSGAPVDVRGAALTITSEMGVLAELRAASTRSYLAVLVDDDGSRIALLARQNSAPRPGQTAEIELPRADLSAVLLRATTGLVELITGDSIASLSQDQHGVSVVLKSGSRRRFDLAIGADGVHSLTRRLIFGGEAAFTRHLGLYVATLAIPDLPDVPSEVQIYNTPGHSCTIHPARDTPGVAFIWRGRPIPDLDRNDLERPRKLIMERYAGQRWRVPELLDRVARADDLYFDAVSRVTLPHWSAGRVALVGDAASCISLLGDGSTKAIIGAHTLAEELSRTTDHQLAYRRYQDRQRRLISSTIQVRLVSQLLVPSTKVLLTARNAILGLANR